MQAECADLREKLASKDEHLSAEAASNLAHAQEIIMLNEEIGRLKVSVRMRACLLSILSEFSRGGGPITLLCRFSRNLTFILSPVCLGCRPC